jgi:hypothetical protein
MFFFLEHEEGLIAESCGYEWHQTTNGLILKYFWSFEL